MSLKTELDRIYEQVYLIKESMSSEESSIFIAGFEEGIDEGIGKWLGKAAGWISDIPNKAKKAAKWVGDKASDLYKRGKDWANKTIDKIKNWMSETFAKVKEWMSDAGKWISEKFETFVQKMKDAFSAMGQKLVEFWEATKEKSKAFWEATKSFFSRMMESIKKGYASAKEWLYKMGGKASEWVKRNWEKLKDFASRAKDKLGDLFNKAIEMIKKGGAIAKKWLDIVALYLITKPAEKIKEWLKKIPELWDRYSKMFGEWLDRQVHDFKVGFEEGSGRPWDRAKGFIEKPEFPEANVKPIIPEEDVTNPETLRKRREIQKKERSFAKYTKNQGVDGAKLFKPLTHQAAQSEVEAAAENLAKSAEFKSKYWNYSETDLRNVLKQKKFTPLAIDWVVYCWQMEKEAKEVTLSSGKKVKVDKKKRMPLPDSFESFRYLKTFEGFSY